MKTFIFIFFLNAFQFCLAQKNHNFREQTTFTNDTKFAIVKNDLIKAVSGIVTCKSAEGGKFELFADDDLKILVDKALQNNQDIKISEHRLNQQQAKVDAAKAVRFPAIKMSLSRDSSNSAYYADLSGTNPLIEQLGLTGDYSNGLANHSAMYLGINAYEIDVWGRLKDLNEGEKKRYLSAEEYNNGVKLNIVTSVIVRYYELIGSVELWKILKSREDLGLLYKQHLEELFRLRRINDFEYRYELSNLFNITAQRIKIERDIRESYNKIYVLTGEASLLTEQEFRNRKPLNFINYVRPAHIDIEDIRSRPDIKSIEHRIASFSHDIDAVRAEALPLFSLNSSVGQSVPEPAKLMNGIFNSWFVGVNVSIPIVDFGKNKADIRQVTSARDGLIAEYDQTIQLAFKDVQDSMDAISFAEKMAENYLNLKEYYKNLITEGEIMMSRGQFSEFDLLRLKNDALSYNYEYTNALRSHAISSVLLYKSLGKDNACFSPSR